ncbi:MAG: MBL fold metallo-hydrolase [Bradymonadaceae bacterium]|nr:MBL fold metallo-hydrolase [Lujinxingiaceae bacterium]
MRRLAFALVGLVAGALLLKGCSTFASPIYEAPPSEHFDGRQFINPDPIDDKGFFDFLRWVSTRKPGYWSDWTDAQPGPKPPERVGMGELRVTFVNHATTLVQVDGLNILTDPVWSMRVGPRPYLGIKRRRPPGIRFEDLPPIDAVLISHNHYDHLDIPTLERLAQAHNPKIFVGLGTNALLECHGLTNGQDLAWGQAEQLGPETTIVRVPAQHFTNLGLTDRNNSQWGGFVITSPAGSVYFAGDTGWGSHFEEIGEQYAPIRLAILPIGAFRPQWFMAPVHISPDEAVDAHEALGAQTIVAMHFGTFALADDGQFEPPIRLDLSAAKRYPVLPRFWVLDFGEGRDVPGIGE